MGGDSFSDINKFVKPSWNFMKLAQKLLLEIASNENKVLYFYAFY